MNAQYSTGVCLDIDVTTPTNRLVDGSCCLSSESPPECTSCPDLRIELCFRHNRADTSNTDITNCTGSFVALGIDSVSGSVTSSFSSEETYTVCYLYFFCTSIDIKCIFVQHCHFAGSFSTAIPFVQKIECNTFTYNRQWAGKN